MSVEADFAEIVGELLAEVDHVEVGPNSGAVNSFEGVKFALEYVFKNGILLQDSEMKTFQSFNERLSTVLKIHPFDSREFFYKDCF